MRRATSSTSLIVALTAAGALLLSACGTSEPAANSATTSSGTTARPVSLTDSRGKTIELKAPARKVVGLEWGVVENLVTRGVMPVGVADVKGYGSWVTAGRLDPSVKDVGVRGQPSVDAVVALDPDLVMVTSDETPAVITQLEKYVPVVVVRGASAENPVGQMRDNLTLTAQAVGKVEEGKKLLADFDATLAAGKARLADAGQSGKEFVFVDGYQEGSTVSVRLYTTGSLLGAVGEQLGLKNVATSGGDKDYGLAQSDVEGLTRLGDPHFLYIASDADGGDPFAKGLAKNAIWKGLPFVRSGDVDRLPDGIWMFGGPASTTQWVDATVAALTS